MEDYDREPFVYESETSPGLKLIRRSTYSLLILKEILKKIAQSRKVKCEEDEERDREPLNEPFASDLPILDPIDESIVKERRTASRLCEIERLLKRLDLIIFRLLDEIRTIKGLLKALKRRMQRREECFCNEMRLYALEDRYCQTLQSATYLSRLKVGLNREKVSLITGSNYCKVVCNEPRNEVENQARHEDETL
ncbi:unnamed protein product [Dimorphilus gyrociliatus]|uniref:Uncharacterized protein n=1 Tax=Dimorphilus gyrociliatus TaxID=2664684 RepID=A0A7I8VJI8_9ANNE|nr:unnamed protein product [Dimorphilus gyrociliatus]